MASPGHRFSLFSQPLDRAAFVAYLLGAVVPLAALAWGLLHFARPALRNSQAFWALAAVVASVAALSLVSFFALRRTMREAVARLDRENHRLQSLLAAARGLTAGTIDHEIEQAAIEALTAIGGAQAGFLLRSRSDGTGFEWLGSAAVSPPERGALRSALETTARAALEALAPVEREVTVGGTSHGRRQVVAVPCALGNGRAGALALWREKAGDLDRGQLPALSTLAALTTVSLRNAEHHAVERNFYTHATNLLVSALDAHLAHQTDHSHRVARLANLIGRALGLPEPKLERLHFAALLHDIGMLRVGREQLTDRNATRRHAELGGEMLAPIRLWEDLAPIVRHHHEWFDGDGYPDGLAGEAIPLESRIIAVAETFDVLTSEQSYKRAISSDEAFARIEAAEGQQFDPEVVAAFAQVRSEGAI